MPDSIHRRSHQPLADDISYYTLVYYYYYLFFFLTHFLIATEACFLAAPQTSPHHFSTIAQVQINTEQTGLSSGPARRCQLIEAIVII